MSDLTWEKLNLLNLEAIDDAATYWSTYIGQLTEAADAIQTDVSKTIDEDSFGEQIGDHCRSQLQHIANEIHDHIDEAANKIKTIIEDAHADLSTCKTNMQGLIDEVVDARLRIKEDGEVYIPDARLAEIQVWAREQAEADGTGDAFGYAALEIERVEEGQCQPLTAGIRGLVQTARGHDDDFTARLNSIRDARVEMPPPLGSDWNEDVAAYWSSRAVDLLNGGEDGQLSAEELDEFNEIVAERADNPVFATTLMNELGPTDLTTHLADVVWRVVGPYDTFTGDQVTRMYEVLGVALATATDPTKERHVDQEWIAELMNLGGSVVTSSSGWEVNGYELLAPALPHGQYHEDFLVPVTEHMIALDAVRDWSNQPPLSMLDNAHPDVTNPVNWALVAIDNNPDAALNLFTDGGTGLEDIDGVNLDDVRPVEDPFAYLMGRVGDYGGGHTTTISPDLLGNALESATTGVPTNQEPPDTPPLHSNHMASLADRLIEHVTANADDFTSGSRSQMIDNLGAITVAYIDDFHQAMGSPGTEVWAVDQRGVDLSLGSPGEENEELADDWLRIIGHDQAATATVWGASEGLMYNQLENALAHDDDQSLSQSNKVFEMHGRVTAALTIGSLDAIANSVYQQAADQNALPDLVAEGARYGAAVGVEAATAALSLNPWAAAAAGQAADHVASDAIGYVADFFRMTEEEAQARIAELAEGLIESNENGMLFSETTSHIEQILRTDPNLNDDDFQTARHDYYRRYWDNVKHYAEMYTG